MKPITPIAFSVLAAALAAPAAAYDAPLDESGFYVGFEGRLDQLSWNTYSFDQKIVSVEGGVETSSTAAGTTISFPQGLMGAGLKFGYRFSRYLALELGYTISSDEKREIDTDLNRFRYRLTLREAQADVLAYLPLGVSGRFKPFLSAGMAFTQADARLRTEVDGSDDEGEKITTATYTSFMKESEINWRIGGGIEVRVSDSTYGRFFARYQPYSFNDALDGGATLGFTVTTRLF